MVTNKNEAYDFIENNLPRLKKNLNDFLKIKSISTDPNHEKDIIKSVDWLKNYLRNIGFSNLKILKCKGHPALFAEMRSKNDDAKTVLVYGHYDVQPPEPTDKWLTPPFEPVIYQDNLFCRGASDMKGQIMASIYAVEAMLSSGELPINIKFLLEGEEEIGSPTLNDILLNNKELLAADIVLNPDAGMISKDTPTITYGLRGLAYFELRIYGPKNDLHSGLFGGIIHNPAIVLSKVIASFHNEDGKVQIPDFYNNVIELDPNERETLNKLPITDENLINQTGVNKLWGENQYTSIERIGIRPTLDINGLYSGFIDEGSKTIIPSYAMAKISMRLVPDQKPDEIYQNLFNYLKSIIPDTVNWELIQMAGSPPSVTNTNIPAIKSLTSSFEEVWGCPPVFKREGGSIPVVLSIQEILGIESILTGFGLPEDNIHGPNEKLHLPTWEKGIRSLIAFLYNYSSD